MLRDNDHLYRRRFSPPPARPVDRLNRMIIDEAGVVQGPFLYEEWLVYGFEKLDRFHDILNRKEKPSWHEVYFRHPDDHYGGIYNHYAPIFLILIQR